jgi:hypothetical protein
VGNNLVQPLPQFTSAHAERGLDGFTNLAFDALPILIANRDPEVVGVSQRQYLGFLS